MIKMFKNISFAVAAAMALPIASSAETITLDKTYSSVFGNPALYSNVTIRNGSENISASAGGFNVTSDAGDSFIAWCIDLAERLSLPSEYHVVSSPFTVGVTDSLSRLFTGYVEGIDTGIKAAAFQVSIWELISDTDMDLENGVFQLLSNTAVRDEANTYLSGLSKFDADYDLSYFVADGTQDLITGQPSPVPLPATGLLLIAGLGLLGLRGRKRA